MTETTSRGQTIRTVLFDLDGTLADTAPDLAYALNTLLQEQGRQPLPYAAIRPEASFGGKGLIHLAFGLESDDSEFEPLRRRFLELYAANLCRDTGLFAGMESVLDKFTKLGLNWGVVTNKPTFLTEPLMAQLGLHERAACIISGDTTNNAKPHPEPLLHACALAGSTPEQCLFVGDARRDIEAGHRAGMRTLTALFGYIRPDDEPETWGADSMIRTPLEILDWLASHA